MNDTVIITPYIRKAPDAADVIESTLNDCAKVLVAKAREYASGTNRFHNFDKAAEVKRESPELAAWGMAMKHLVSVIDIIEKPDAKNVTEELVNEKFGDLINYLLLIKAMIVTRRIHGRD